MAAGDIFKALLSRTYREPNGSIELPSNGMTVKEAIGKNELAKAVETLKKYKDGKANLEKTIVENEKWYKLRHWEVFKGTTNNGERKAGDERPEPASAWLFNSLTNKHADAMDNFPEPNVLPREQ